MKENPHSVEPQRYLALAYKHYRDIHKCAISYQLAASYATDNEAKAELLGCAAVEYAREGEKTSVEHIIGQIRDLLVAGAGERQLLQTLHEIAVIRGESEISIASLERTVELDPSDIRSRIRACVCIWRSVLRAMLIPLYRYSGARERRNHMEQPRSCPRQACPTP